MEAGCPDVRMSSVGKIRSEERSDE